MRGLFLALVLCLCPSLSAETLIGGREVDRAGFPELVRISVMNGRATCSAALIGPRVLLTAAHCSTPLGEVVPVSEFEEVDVEHVAGAFKAVCDIAPLYRTQDHDMALCLTDRDIESRYAIVSKEPVRLGQVVSLSGFGCRDSQGRGGNNGTLKVGEAPVVQLAKPAEKSYWFYTRGEAALCFGDSGGPAFARLVDGSPKKVIGVNSRGNISDLSLLTALSLDVSQAFMRDFEHRHGVQICGLSVPCAPGKP